MRPILFMMQQDTNSGNSTLDAGRCRQLENGLVFAVGKLRAARLRWVAVKAAERAFQVVSVALGAGTVLFLIGKALGDSTLVPALGLISLGVVISGVWILAMLWPAGERGSAWDEAAERLDLAVGDHNSIATALDFIRSGVSSPIADRAIGAGLTAATAYSAVDPVAAEPNSWPLRSAGVAVGAAGLFLLACITPVLTVPSIPASLPNGPAATTVHKKSSASASPSAKAVLRTLPDFRPLSPANASPTVGVPAAEPAASSDIASNVGGADFAGQSTGMASVPAPSRSDPVPRSAPKPTDADARRSAARPNAIRSQPAAVGQNGSMNQSSGNGDSDGAAAESDSNPNLPQEAAERSDDPSGGPADGAGLLPDEKAKSQAPLDQGDGSHIRKSDARGSNKGSNDQSGDQSGPNGRSGGQNSPKKARGVASLMLGSRQADLVKGRPSAGAGPADANGTATGTDADKSRRERRGRCEPESRAGDRRFSRVVSRTHYCRRIFSEPPC